MRIDDVMMQEVAFAIEDDQFATRTETRVEGKYSLLSQGCRHQELFEIAHENEDSLLVGLLLGTLHKLRLDAWAQQTLEAVGDGIGDERRSCRTTALHILATEPVDAKAFVASNRQTQHALGFATTHGQQTMAGTTLQGFAPVEVIAELLGSQFLGFAQGLRTLHTLRGDDGIELEIASDGIARLFVLGHHLGNDVLRPLEGFVGIGHAFFGIDVLCTFELDIPLRGRALLEVTGLRQQELCQRLQALFACHHGTCPALWLIGQIDILELGGIPAVVDAMMEGIGQFALLFDCGKYGNLALLQFTQFLVLVVDGSNLHFVERTGRLLAITADEGYGTT